LVVFVSRDHCISCGSADLAELGGGRFGDEPLRSFVESDPWGENPIGLLENQNWSLVQCAHCSQAFHRFILSPEWNEIRFSRWMSEEAIRKFEEEHGTGENAAQDHVAHVLRLRDLGVAKILDFGCGFGQFLQMCQLFGLEAIGVDRSQARRSGSGLSIFAELDEVQGNFDAITLFEVLEHLDDPLATLETLRSRLNLGGMIIVEVPDATGVTTINSRESYYKIHPLDHINAFTPETLAGILRQAGFEPITKKPAFVTTSLARVAKGIARARLKPTTQQYFKLAP
jgi:SAM-dependent methyltransferase